MVNCLTPVIGIVYTYSLGIGLLFSLYIIYYYKEEFKDINHNVKPLPSWMLALGVFLSLYWVVLLPLISLRIINISYINILNEYYKDRFNTDILIFNMNKNDYSTKPRLVPVEEVKEDNPTAKGKGRSIVIGNNNQRLNNSFNGDNNTNSNSAAPMASGSRDTVRSQLQRMNRGSESTDVQYSGINKRLITSSASWNILNLSGKRYVNNLFEFGGMLHYGEYMKNRDNYLFWLIGDRPKVEIEPISFSTNINNK